MIWLRVVSKHTVLNQLLGSKQTKKRKEKKKKRKKEKKKKQKRKKNVFLLKTCKKLKHNNNNGCRGMNRIGTDAYDKWLAEMRQTTNIYAGQAYDECCEYHIYKHGRTPKQQEQAYLKYKRAQTREGNKVQLKMIVKHKSVYYKEMETKQVMKRWKVFDEVSDLNDEMKQEIRKFLY